MTISSASSSTAQPTSLPLPEPPPSEPGVEAQYGDTPESIAAANGITVEKLREANPDLTAVVYPGQTLQLPESSDGGLPLADLPVGATTPSAAPTLIAKADENPLQQAANISSNINTWGGYAGALHYKLNQTLNLEGKLQNTQAGVDTALKQRANIAVGRELVSRGFDKTIQQTTSLLNNPIVQKDAGLVSRLQNQLRIATQAKADALKPFNASIDRLNHFLIANGSKLANLSKQAKAFAAIGDTLTYAGGITNGFSVAVNSPATTQAGKVVDGILAGVVNVGFGKATPLAGIGAVDAITGQNVANSLNGVVATAVTVTEATLTGDTQGLRNLAAKTQNGDYGAFLQAGNAAGNALVSLESASTRERYVEDAAAGKYGPVGQFGNALGEGLFNIYHNLGGR
jgi:LysM repeat protein